MRLTEEQIALIEAKTEMHMNVLSDRLRYENCGTWKFRDGFKYKIIYNFILDLEYGFLKQYIQNQSQRGK